MHIQQNDGRFIVKTLVLFFAERKLTMSLRKRIRNTKRMKEGDREYEKAGRKRYDPGYCQKMRRFRVDSQQSPQPLRRRWERNGGGDPQGSGGDALHSEYGRQTS